MLYICACAGAGVWVAWRLRSVRGWWGLQGYGHCLQRTRSPSLPADARSGAPHGLRSRARWRVAPHDSERGWGIEHLGTGVSRHNTPAVTFSSYLASSLEQSEYWFAKQSRSCDHACYDAMMRAPALPSPALPSPALPICGLHDTIISCLVSRRHATNYMQPIINNGK